MTANYKGQYVIRAKGNSLTCNTRGIEPFHYYDISNTGTT